MFGPGVCGAVVVGVAVFGPAGIAAGVGARWLLGRLRRGTRVRAPVCEVAVGCAWAGLGGAWAAGAVPSVWLAVLLATAWFGVAAGLVDLRHRRLPDALTLPALPGALLLVTPLGPPTLVRAVLGAGVAVAVHAAVHLAAPASMGAGDVKLAAPLGAVLSAASWPAVLLAAVLASVLTVVLGTVRSSTRAVPHGPSMLLATFLVVGAAALVPG